MKLLPWVVVPVLALCRPLAAGCAEPLQKPCSGSVDRHYIYSPELSDTITVDVWLPETYSAGREVPYPVIYMHDGQNLFDADVTWNHQSWEMDSVATALIDAGMIKAPVIVGVHSKSQSRLGDLMPQKAFYMIDNLPDTVTYGGHAIDVKGDAYAHFVARTLKGQLDSIYNLSALPEETIVMGSSMGGLMSIYMICEYPETFGGAGCLSTHWPGDPMSGWPLTPAMLKYLDSNLPPASNHKLYFDHGTADIDAYYGPGQTAVLELVREKGYTDGVNLEFFFDSGAGHQEKYWAKRVYRPLEFLLPYAPN